MKSMPLIKKGISVLMAALVSASTVFPVYAADMDDGYSVSEENADATTDEQESKKADVVTEYEETDAEAEKEAVKGDPEDDTTDIGDAYALVLPISDDVSYSYDEDHFNEELSTDEMEVLVYTEGETVSLTAESEKEISIVDGYTEEVIVSSDSIIDGKISFTMPSTDLMLTLSDKDQTESTESETKTETDNQTDVQTEQDSSSDVENTQKEDRQDVDTETDNTETDDKDTDSKEDSEESEDATKQDSKDSQTESDTVEEIGSHDNEGIVCPESGSIETAKTAVVYFKDTDFDYKSYTPESQNTSDADIEWIKGDITFGSTGSYVLTYKATLKTDSSYFWYIQVPFEVVEDKGSVTAHSDDFENKIFMNTEQSSEFTGEVPEINGSHIQGKDIEVVKGEDFDLQSVNFDYDMNLFMYEVQDNGGFDTDKVGTYKVTYVVTTYEDSDIKFYIDCNVTVKDNISNEDTMTVHIKSTELEATATDIQGNTYDAHYGIDAVSANNLKELVVSSAWQGTTDIEPEITVLENGEEVSKDGIITSEGMDGEDYVVNVNPELDKNDKYVFVIDWPTYDPTNGGQVAKSGDRRTNDYVAPTEDSDSNSEGIMLLTATSKVQKTWTGTGLKSSVTNGSSSCHCYGWDYTFIGYRRYQMNLSSSFKSQLSAWLESQGAQFSDKIPEYISIFCSEGGGTHLAWDGWRGTSLSITATIYKNSKGEPYKLSLYADAPGQYTSQGQYQEFTGIRTASIEENDGSLKIVKKSLGKFTATFWNVNLTTTFGLYEDAACTKLVRKINIVPDDGDSLTATRIVEGLDADEYYVKETSVAPGHMKNRNAYHVKVEANQTTTLSVGNTPYVFNGRLLAKTDKESKAAVAGAVYKINGKVGNQNFGVWYMKTDKDGYISFDESHYLATWNGKKSNSLPAYGDSGIKYGLPLNTVITATEVESPDGYVLDSKSYTTKIVSKSDSTKYLTCDVIKVSETPAKGKLVIKKTLDPDEPEAIKENRDLTKVGFTLTRKLADGTETTYTYKNPVSGKKETVLHPDEDGNLTIEDIDYGTWTITEVSSTDYHKASSSKTVVINSETSEVYYENVNYRYEDLLTIQKKDSDTGNLVPRGNCSVQIKDEAGNLVSLKVKKGDTTDTFTTDENGQIHFDEKIPAGKYTLVEISAPDGYEIAEPYSFEITGLEKDNSVIVTLSDKRVTTSVSVEKKDSVSGNSAGKGFSFNIVADEDVTDLAGTTYEGLSAGSVVDTITTDANGVATSSVALYPGKYHLEETNASTGYNKDASNVSFEVVTEKDSDGNWIATVEGFDNGVISVKDSPVMRPIQIVKTDSISGNNAGANFTFTITADNVTDASGKTREGYEKGTVVDTVTTDGRGIATSKDLYCGTYIVKETVSSGNYVLSTKEYPVTVSDENKTTEAVNVNISDNPVTKKVQVTKINAQTGNHCGAGFKFNIIAAEDILDGSGNAYDGYKAGDVVDTITTNDEGIATSKGLYMGSYYIQETEVTDGMAINSTKYSFTLTKDKDVKDTDDVVVLPLENIADQPTTLNIKKVDALLDKDGNSILDDNGQPIDGAEPKALEGVTFRVKEKDAEDSDDQLYKTDKNGSIKIEYLKKNTTYVIQETETLKGYNLNSEPQYFTVDENGLINGSSSYSVTFTNQPNIVSISKVDITNGNELEGALLKLTDSKGNVVDEWTSTGKSHLIYGLESGDYNLIESTAPDGYELSETINFKVADSEVVQQVVMKDSPYRSVDISKTDIAGSAEIPGCTLTVRDSHGDLVETWTSTEEPHRLVLESGVYSLTEEKPADGYVTADTIDFTVNKTSETDYDVQAVQMKDEVTKVYISKKDITNDEELPGAKLQIKDSEGNVVEEWVSTNEEHYIEKLPIGKYTLTEITAPDGYEVAETMTFEVKDTAEEQHYTMYDSPYRPVQISKVDITSKEELPGATLEIRDSNNEVVESWVSTSETHEVNLPHGKYTLIETKPADGYVTAESINFEVLERNTKEDDGVEVQLVTMEDDVTKVEISKQDVTTKKELAGAKLKITDSNGKVVEEWTSTDEVHYIEKLAIGKYTLTETTAPNGYEVAENVEFEVLDTGEIQHVIMYDSPTTSSTTNTPTTGDFNPIVPIACGIIIVVLAGTGVYFKKKKSK